MNRRSIIVALLLAVPDSAPALAECGYACTPSSVQSLSGESSQAESFLADAGNGQLCAGTLSGVRRVDGSTGVMQPLHPQDAVATKPGDVEWLLAGKYSAHVQALNHNLAPSQLGEPITALPKLRYATYGFLATLLGLVVAGAGFLVLSQRRQNKRMAGDIATAVESRLRLEEELRNSQKLECLGTLALGMAHDFNNMIQVVYICSELAIQTDDREVIVEQIETIQEAAQQAQGVTQSILTLAGRHETNVESVDLVDLVAKCVNMIRHTTPQSVRIDFQTGGEKEIRASIDSEQINQAIFNLLINARDAMPDGGALSVSVQSGTKDDQQWVQIEVCDTGSGIESAQLEKIFDPFYTTKPCGEGTGLGLAMAHAIICAHDGSITVKSEPQGGTCFTIRLPQTVSSNGKSHHRIDRAASAAQARTAFGKRDRTILVAEYCPLVRKMILDVMESNGCRMLIADNGARALELAHDNQPDVIILGVDMPILDGISVLDRLRAAGNHTRAVIVTDALPDRTLPGNTVVLPKPFTIDELLTATFDERERQAAPHGS